MLLKVSLRLTQDLATSAMQSLGILKDKSRTDIIIWVRISNYGPAVTVYVTIDSPGEEPPLEWDRRMTGPKILGGRVLG